MELFPSYYIKSISQPHDDQRHSVVDLQQLILSHIRDQAIAKVDKEDNRNEEDGNDVVDEDDVNSPNVRVKVITGITETIALITQGKQVLQPGIADLLIELGAHLHGVC